MTGADDIDHTAVLEGEVPRVLAALAADRTGVIPWSTDGWTVEACAHHVAGVLGFFEGVLAGRPTAGFEVRGGLSLPEAGDQGLGPWIEEAAGRLVALLRAADPSEPCWSWWPEATTVAFWPRRAAHEIVVHRWDLERGAGIDGPAMDAVVAADGVDEFLDPFLGMGRFLHTAPGAGETVHLHCTDTDGEWLVTFPAPAERTVERVHAKGDVAYRGRAEDLLLFLWGRTGPAPAGVEVLGDPAVAARWPELSPSL